MSELMRRHKMTQSRRKVYSVIEALLQFGFPPSYQEIRNAAGFKSKSTVSAHLYALRDCGYIAFEPYRKRTIRLTDRRPSEAA